MFENFVLHLFTVPFIFNSSGEPDALKKSGRHRHLLMNSFADFVNFIDSIYFEGYAEQLQETDPDKLCFEFAEFQSMYA